MLYPDRSTQPPVSAVMRYRDQYLKSLYDSGSIDIYQPATTNKPQRLLDRVGRAIRSYDQTPWIEPGRTTQLGSAAASPTTYAQSLWPSRIERGQLVADLWDSYLNDPATFKAVNMYSYEAVRAGCKIRVVGEDEVSKYAQEIADKFLKMWPTFCGPTDGVSLFGAVVSMITIGDLFIQGAVTGSPGAQSIARFLTMPAAGMERNTDDSDQFVDTKKAFSQVDTMTFSDVVPQRFPLWSVCHLRMNYVGGNKYGNSEILPIRRLRRSLELMEASKITQVQTRAPLRYLWMFGTPENPATPDEVQTLMGLNGFVQGKRAIFDPAETARDIFMNGVGDVKPISGDAAVSQVEHLKYFLERYTNALPTPRQLMGLDAAGLNRDTLEDLRGQWVLDTVRANQQLEILITWFLNTQFRLHGIDPDTIKMEFLWSKSSQESEKDRIATLSGLWESGLVSQETVISLLQEFTHIPSVEAEIKAIQEDEKRMQEQEQPPQPGMEGGMPEQPFGDGFPGTYRKRTNGHHTGYNGNGKLIHA